MLSGIKRDELKRKAIALRRRGDSYPMIEKKLGIGRSTLSGWFRNIKLSQRAERIILRRKQQHIKEARSLAAQAHWNNREAKKKVVEENILQDFSLLSLTVVHKEALLAMLYLGEGFKRRSTVGLGNSNPRLLSLFVRLLREIYEVSNIRLSCYVHLRADQDSAKEKRFWSKVLKIPMPQFRKSQTDKRTIGKKTWKGYHGVCIVYCHDAYIEKRLTAWQELLLEKI